MRDAREYERDAYRGGMPYREGRSRQMPRRMRERKRDEAYSREKRRGGIGFLIVCGLLAMNLMLMLELQIQVRGLQKDLNQVLGGMSVSWQEDPPAKETQTKEDVQNPTYGASGTDAKDGILDYVSLCGLAQVDAPADRSPEEVLVCLQELAQDYEQIAEIYEQHSLYSDDMLKALANNPEMADFVKNSLGGRKRPSDTGLSDLEKSQEYPLFLQWDPRWGYVSYGDDNIGLSGCGPTCLSMAMYYLLGDESITPETVAEYSMKNDHYVMGTGTAWALLEEYPAVCGVSVEQPSTSEDRMKRALDDGGVIICSMGPGDFTAVGHFVVIYGYDSKGFFVNDSNCVARSREKWDYERLEGQIKHMWIYK